MEKATFESSKIDQIERFKSLPAKKQ